MSDELSAAVRQTCESQEIRVGVWVRGLMEREVGNPEVSKFDRVLKRLDVLEDQVANLVLDDDAKHVQARRQYPALKDLPPVPEE